MKKDIEKENEYADFSSGFAAKKLAVCEIMTKVFSFVKLDWYLVKAYWKSLLIFLGLAVVMGLGFKSPSTLSSYFMVMLIITMSYPFAVAEKNRLDILYGTLSVNRKNVVIGRYLFILLFTIMAAIISLVFSAILSAILKQEIIISQFIFTTCLMFAVCALVVALQYPIYFKYGYTKAKLAAMIPLFAIFLLFLLVPLLSNLFDMNISLDNIFESITNYTALSCVCFIVVGLILLSVSCLVSYKIYSKKDI